jgi:hypothetical protein
MLATKFTNNLVYFEPVLGFRVLVLYYIHSMYMRTAYKFVDRMRLYKVRM